MKVHFQMPKSRKWSRSCSHSRERSSKGEKSSKKFKNLQSQIDNLTKCVQNLIDCQTLTKNNISIREKSNGKYKNQVWSFQTKPIHRVVPFEHNPVLYEQKRSTRATSKIKLHVVTLTLFSDNSDQENVELNIIPEKACEDKPGEVDNSVMIENESTDSATVKRIENQDHDLDPEFLELIGEEISSTNSEIKIDEGIIKWWKKWMAQGLEEEDQEEIVKKYPTEGKFYTKAPIVNLEIECQMTEIGKKTRPTFC